MSDSSAASLPQEFATPYPPFHVVPFLRMAAVLGTTLWTVNTLMLARYPQRALHQWARATLRCLGVRLEIRGTLDESAQLWVSNHLSWLDPLVLLSLRPMGALAKGEVSQYPLIGSASRRVGLAFVDRLDATSRASAVVRLSVELRQGKPMLLFPEGTTTRGHNLAPLQEGGLRAAYRCGTTIQTLRLSSPDPGYPWIGDDSLLPHLVRIVQASVTPVRLEAGAVLEPRHFSHEDVWIDAIRQELTPIP